MKLISTKIILLITIFSFGFTFEIEKAQAVVAVSDSVVRGTTNATLKLVQTLIQKEFQYDPAANAAKTQAANAFYNEIRRWLAAGNNGSPMFWDNLELQLQQLEATTTMAVIDEIAANGNICGAFKNEIIVQLKQSYIQNNLQNVAQKTSCEFEEASADAEGFVERGEFTIQALYATMRGGSPIEEFLVAEDLVRQEAAEQVQLAMENFRAGQGYREQYEAGQNVLVCASGRANGGELNGVRNRCRLASPAYATALRSGVLPDLEVAMIMSGDELGETQASPFSQLGRQTAATGITGRAGNTPPPTPEPEPEPTPEPQCDGITPSAPTSTCNLRVVAGIVNTATSSPTGNNNIVRDPLTQTLQRFSTQLDTIAMLEDLRKAHLSAENAFASLSCYDATYPPELLTAEQSAVTTASGTLVALVALHELLIDYDEAVADSTSTAPVAADLQALQSNNPWVANATEVDAEQIAFTTLRDGLVANFRQTHTTQLQACQQI